MNDAVLIMQYLSNSDTHKLDAQQQKNADCSGNGNGISVMDALAIQKYLLQLIPSLPET